MMLGYFLGISMSFAGLGGLLSGVFARSFRRAMLWALGFGLLEVVLLFNSRVALGFVIVGLFWGLVGWVVVGRPTARRREAKAVTLECQAE
jgi:hypothetical protein